MVMGSGHTLHDCLSMLNERHTTHPNLVRIWTDYLMTRTPSSQDLRDCVIAVKNMDTIKDIDVSHLPAIYGIGTMLSANKQSWPSSV